MRTTPYCDRPVPDMASFSDINRYLRTRLTAAKFDVGPVSAALKHRGVARAAAAGCAAIAILVFPGTAAFLAASLLALIVSAVALPPANLHAEASEIIDAPIPQPTVTVNLTPGTVVQALGDPALTLDRHLCVVDANAAAEDIFGGVHLGEHISKTTRNPELTAAAVTAIRQQKRETFALVIRTPLERHLEGVAAPLEADAAPDGKAVVLLYLRDLTEQERLASMRADFVANASHELRTPLASLKGFIETMQGPARNDPAAHVRFLEIMNAQAQRMTRLIDDLLSLSRIEMRAHILPNATVDLNEIAASVVAGLEPQAKLADVAVTVVPLASPAVVRGDHDELVQGVQNLVQNAIKYGRAGGVVTVDIKSEPDGRISLSVSDDGPGISPEHLPRLTERFYRVNVASSRERGGTGLGLAIVKHIVTRHRGTLTIKSTPTKGSTFTINLPSLSR